MNNLLFLFPVDTHTHALLSDIHPNGYSDTCKRNNNKNKTKSRCFTYVFFFFFLASRLPF